MHKKEKILRALIRRTAFYSLFLILLTLTTAYGNTIEIPNSGLKIDVQPKWQAAFEEGSLNIKSPDGGSVGMAFVTLENPDLQAAVQEAEKEIIEAVGPLNITQNSTEGEMNGLKYVEQLATAMDGKLNVSLTLVLSPTQKWVLIAYFGAVAKEAQWQADLGKMAASLQPISAAKAAPKPPTSPRTAANSFKAPFTTGKALALLFTPPSPNGDAGWQPRPGMFAKVAQPNPGNSKAITRAIGFTSYDYDETTTQVMFLYKTSFLATQQFANNSVIGAALFNCENGVCKPVWNNPAIIQYANYKPKTDFRFVKIGQGYYGALVEAGGTHQGITTTNAVLLADYKGKIIVAAKDLPVYEDNEGAASSPSLAYKFKTNIVFEPGSHQTYYNMKIKFSGTTMEEYDQGGKMISRVIPANFSRVFYWDKDRYEEEIECDGPVSSTTASNPKVDAMLPVFDSVMRTLYPEDRSINKNNYSSKNKNLVWSILYHLAVNYGHEHPLIKVKGDKLHVPYKTMQELATGCFADYDDLIAPPRTFQAVSFNNALNSYELALSDSGLSFAKILNSTPLANNTYEVKVGFFEEEEDKPFATYQFTIVPNAYAKMVADAKFHYAIKSVKKIK
jgi:hypothetical protein